jgi:hypothetical protein
MELFEKVDYVAHYNYQDSNGAPLNFVKFRGSCWGPTGPKQHSLGFATVKMTFDR